MLALPPICDILEYKPNTQKGECIIARRKVNYEEARQLYHLGESIEELADRYGVTKSTIYRALDSMGVDVSNRQMDYGEVRRLYEAGIHTSEIAKRYGVTRSAVYFALRSMGVTQERKDINQNINEVDLAYIAGLLDGEGSINILSSRSRCNQFWLSVTIANNHLPTLEWVMAVVDGGAIKNAHGRMRPSDTAPVYKWQICSRQAADLLSKLLPFLRIKREQAEVAIEFQNRLEHNGALSEHEIAVRNALKNKLQGLRTTDRTGN